MNYFKNYDALINHGYRNGRRVALECINAALNAANTYEGTKRRISCSDTALYVNKEEIPFDTINNIYVVGAGKGTYPVIKALDELLGKRIKAGVVALKDPSEQLPESNIEIIYSSHPVPNKKSLEAGVKIAEIAGKLTDKDLVFVCVTGGCSSLMVLPPVGLTIEDISALGGELMKCGAPISALNTVRKHTCLLKGGGLLKMLSKAQVITLTQDTRPENLPWPDPVLADPTTFSDAIDVLKNYEMWEKAPQNVRNYLLEGLVHPERESLKSTDGIRHRIFDVGNQRTACEAAVLCAEKQGYNGYILSTKIEGEAKEVGCAMAGIAKEIHIYDRPFKAPCVLISAGETRVTVNVDAPGDGGPNQEFVLGFAQSIQNYDRIVCISIDSEGTDGPTQIAGGIVDASTIYTAKKMGLDVFSELKKHDSSHVLKEVGDAVFTGPTGTNVVNLRAIVIEKGTDSER